MDVSAVVPGGQIPQGALDSSPIEVSQPRSHRMGSSKELNTSAKKASPLMAVHASVGEAIAKAEESLEASEKISPRLSPRGSGAAFRVVSSDHTSLKGSPSSKVSTATT